MSRWAVSSALGVPAALREAQAQAQARTGPGMKLDIPGAIPPDAELAEAAKAPTIADSNVRSFPAPQLVRQVTLTTLLDDARKRADEIRGQLATMDALQKELAALEAIIHAGEAQ